MADNDHKAIPDEQLHVPKGFASASPGMHLTKDFNSQNTYDWMYWQNPVLDFVDGAAAPPTENLGDRYVILELSTSVEDAGWDGAAFEDIVEFVDIDLDGTGDTWVSVTPQEGFAVYDFGASCIWIFDIAWICATPPGGVAERSDNAVALTGGNDAILFAGVGGNLATPYGVIPYAYDAGGNPLAVRITNRAATGFTAKAPKAGFLDYIAKQKTT